MILYNVTVSIDASIEDDFLHYMRKKHLPEVMQTGCFLDARFCRVHGEEEGGVTYATTFCSPNEAKLEEYQSKFSAPLQEDFNQKWSGKFAAFRTTLTVVEEFKA